MNTPRVRPWFVVCFVVSVGAAYADPSSPKRSKHWSHQPVERPDVPSVDSPRVRNPIDAFALRRSAESGLALAPDANRRTLIRRATLDLHGLPPTPEEIDAFVADDAPDAYERLVERLLASPRYGERWARHWLDLVRFAESDGYKSDRFRPGVWHYRDWVIRAFNEDKPYDRFAAEQIAGDEIAPSDSSALVATGYLRHWPYEDNGRTLPDMWQVVLNDVTDVTGSVFLGLTVACARCHDHKFDPISQRDYYGLQAYFAAMAPRDDVLVGSPQSLARYREQLTRWEGATKDLRAEKRALEAPFWRKVAIKKSRKFPMRVQEIAALEPSKRSVLERQIMMLGGAELKPNEKEMLGSMPKEAKTKWKVIEAKLKEFDAIRPKSPPLARGVKTLDGAAPSVRIPGSEHDSETIRPAVFKVLRAAESATSDRRGEGRTALVEWLTDPVNPLTARVMVNRIWQHHFGRGIVATPSDFGFQAEPPSHPELLDWLASEFVRRGWSVKEMHRLVLTSSLYRQASVVGGELVERGREIDPENRLLWRMSVRRVEAEVLRDSILAGSGELNSRMFGASVFPLLPPGISDRYAWKPTADPLAQARRSVYLVVKRNMHLPLLKTFDLPDNHGSCAERAETTTPTQALMLLNDGWFLERAETFAGRLLREAGADREALITRAYELAFGRRPSDAEARATRTFLEEQAIVVAERKARGELIATPRTAPEGIPEELGAAVVDLCHALWNTNEFIYVD